MHYYDYHKILSYNIPVNVLIGERGVGKSFGAKDFVINQFLKHRHQFLYLRRYDNELKSVFEKDPSDPNHKDFFEQDLKDKYKNHTLVAKKRKFYIDGECFGFAKRMTEAQDLKSGTFSNIKTIIIDEYPIEKNKRYYLPDEGMILMGLFDSICRNRSDVRIFILGNAVEGLEYSPLFNFFDLTLPYNNDIKIFKDRTILVQYMNNEEFRKDRENTLIGKLAKGTRYEQYAINNKILDKNRNFVEKKKGTSKFSFAFVVSGETYGVWFDYVEGKIFVSDDYIQNTPFMFSCTLADHTPNTMFLSVAKKYSCWRTFIDNFKLGNVRYENMKIKHNVELMIKNML